MDPEDQEMLTKRRRDCLFGTHSVGLYFSHLISLQTFDVVHTLYRVLSVRLENEGVYSVHSVNYLSVESMVASAVRRGAGVWGHT
jgi:hypothetical protein